MSMNYSNSHNPNNSNYDRSDYSSSSTEQMYADTSLDADADTSMENEVVEMIKCEDCGHMVPASNMTIHSVRGCLARKRPAQPHSEREREREVERETEQRPFDFGASPNVSAYASMNEHYRQQTRDPPPFWRNNAVAPAPPSTFSTPVASALHSGTSSSPICITDTTDRNRNSSAALADEGGGTAARNVARHPHARPIDLFTLDRTTGFEEDDDDDEDIDAIPPVRIPPATQPLINRNPTSENHNQDDIIDIDDDDDDDDRPTEMWACPACTLLNSITNTVCEACQTRNPSQTDRPPDPVRQEQLIPDDFSNSPTSLLDMPSTYLSGGALIGGIMGAAGAYMRGRPIYTGVLGGAVSGAVGGVVLQDLLRDQQPTSQQQQQQYTTNTYSSPTARASTTTTDMAMPTSSGPTVRTVRRRLGPNGSMTMTTTSYGTNRNNSTNNYTDDPVFLADPFLESMLLRTFFLQSNNRHYHAAGGGGINNVNIDSMNYDQLLQMFGDGSENRGADEAAIQALPCSTVVDPDRTIPEEHRSCMVCLEPYQEGEQRKTLPCLHGFHDVCIDKWLRANGSCPICKYSIGGR